MLPDISQLYTQTQQSVCQYQETCVFFIVTSWLVDFDCVWISGVQIDRVLTLRNQGTSDHHRKSFIDQVQNLKPGTFKPEQPDIAAVDSLDKFQAVLQKEPWFLKTLLLRDDLEPTFRDRQNKVFN